MCGIVGLVAAPGQSLDLSDAQLVRMRDIMTPRGPDDAGLLRRGPVALAHRRLAIRDRFGGRQPWLSPDGQTALIYNGELYNDGELRAELSRGGWRFQSRCDTEVVLAAYRQWGTSFLDRLRGMFALAIYDFASATLFTARDRFGIKPLFFARAAGGIQVASSIACLLAHPSISKQPNMSVVSHYLSTLRLTLERETVYAGIQQLLPGESLRFVEGDLSIDRYWDYPDPPDSDGDFAGTVEQLAEVLEEAVRIRLVSDVPVGLFMSGGVDSSAIAALVRKHHARPMIGRCGGGDGGDRSDFQFAAKCARWGDFDYDEVQVAAEEYQRDWLYLLQQYRTPLTTPSDVIIFRLAQSMARDVGVVLGGEGADEALCGYARPHWAGYDYELQQALAGARWNHGAAAAQLFLTALRSQYQRDTFDSLADHYLVANNLIPLAAKQALFQPAAWQAADEDRTMRSFYVRQLGRRSELPAVEKYTRLLHRYNLESLLARLDAATMQASLEARVPYTDHLLVEQMFRAPFHHKIAVAAGESAPYLPSGALDERGSIESKRPLRALAAALLPAELAHRKKASFPTPVQSWLAGPWSRWAANQLRHSPFARELFRPAAIDELAGNVAQAGMMMWPLLNVAMWGDQEFGSGIAAETELPAFAV